MNNFALLSLAEMIASITFGIHAYSRNPRARLNQVFFLFCANTSWSAFVEFVYLIADSGEVAQLWTRIGLVWFVAPLLLCFVLIYTHHENWLGTVRGGLILFSPAVLFSITDLVPGMTLLQAERMWWGWTPTYGDNPLNFIELGWGFLLTASAFYLAWRFSRHALNILEKKQALLIALTILCQMLLGFTTVLVIPSLGISLPELPNLWLLVGCVFIGYAIAKFHLFALSPAAAVEGVLAMMSEAFLLVDPSGKIIGVNPATTSLLGFGEGEIVNRPVESIFKGCNFDAPELREGDLGVLLVPEQVRNLEMCVRSQAGATVPLSVSKSKLVDGKGRLQGFIFLLLDLTAFKRAEEARLEERDHVTREFVTKFSHELRTPLNAIIGFSEVLLDQVLGPLNAPQLDCTRDVWESGQYLLDLVNEILDLTEIERGNISFQLEEFSLQDLIKALKPAVDRANRKKQLVITYDMGLVADPRIISIRQQLQQVLLNLLANAIKFTPPGGRVTLVIRERDDGRIDFTVEDSGPGIPEVDHSKIFQKFFHPDPGVGGTGLGLALSKQVVAHLGGDLQFESVPGKGSKFYFTLPRQLQVLAKTQGSNSWM